MGNEQQLARPSREEVDGALRDLREYKTTGKIDTPGGIGTTMWTLYGGKEFLEKPEEIFNDIREVGRDRQIWGAMYRKIIETDRDETIPEGQKALIMPTYLGIAKILGITEAGVNVQAALDDLEKRYTPKETSSVGTNLTSAPSMVIEPNEPASTDQDLSPEATDKAMVTSLGDVIDADSGQPAEYQMKAVQSGEVLTGDGVETGEAKQAEQERIRKLLNKNPFECTFGELQERSRLWPQLKAVLEKSIEESRIFFQDIRLPAVGLAGRIGIWEKLPDSIKPQIEAEVSQLIEKGKAGDKTALGILREIEIVLDEQKNVQSLATFGKILTDLSAQINPEKSEDPLLAKELSVVGNYLWRAPGGDIPVRVTGSLGKGSDGREYVSVEGDYVGDYKGGVPRDQLIPAENSQGVLAETKLPIEVITIGQEAIGTKPEALLHQINKWLSSSNSSEISLQTTPQSVLDYLKTVALPAGARIKDSTTAQINGQELRISGAVGTLFGDAKFDVTFRQTRDGELAVVGIPKVDTGWLLKNTLKAKGIDLEYMIAHLDQLATDEIGKRIDPNWGLKGFGIAGDKLAFDFKQKPKQIEPYISRGLRTF